MSTQRKSRERPLAALLGGIIWMLLLFAGSPPGYGSTVSIRFSAQTQPPTQATTQPPAQSPTPAQPPWPWSTPRPTRVPTRPGGSGGYRGNSSAEPAPTSAEPQATKTPGGVASWHVYTGVDLLVGATREYAAGVHMLSGTLHFSFASNKPHPSNTKRAEFTTTFSAESKRILAFFMKEDALPPDEVVSWPDPAVRVPSAAELLRPFIRESEPYFFDMTTVLIWD